MADLNKNKKAEDDPIKLMLEKLRQSVAAPIEEEPPVGEEVAPVAEEPKKKRTAAKPKAAATTHAQMPETDDGVETDVEQKDGPVDIFAAGLVTELPAAEGIEAPAAPGGDSFAHQAVTASVDEPPLADKNGGEMPQITAFDDVDGDAREDDADDAEVLADFDDEDVEDMDDEENVDEADGEDAVDDDIIAQFFAPSTEEDADTPDVVEELPVAPVLAEEDDGREYDVVSFEDGDLFAEDEEEHPVATAIEKDLEVEDISWQTSVSTKEDVALPEKAEEPEEPEEFSTLLAQRAAEEDEFAVSEQEAALLFRSRGPKTTYTPISQIEEDEEEDLPIDEAEPVIANEDNGYAVEVEVRPVDPWYMPTTAPVGAVQDIVSPVEERAQQEPETAAQAEPETPSAEAAETVEDFVVDDTDEGDAPTYLQMDETDSDVAVEEPELPVEEQPAPAIPQEEKPSVRRVLAAFFVGKETGAKRKKVWNTKNGNNAIPDALSGIYNEAGADYHEYTSRNQISLFSERFKAELTSCTVRIFALAFLCTLLLLLENIGHVGVTIGGFFAQPGGMAATHLILLAFVVLCSIPLFSYAWRHLFGNRILPEIYLAMCLLFALLYDVYLLLAAVPTPYLFGLVPAIGALALSVVERAKIKGDYDAFRLVSSAGDKLACAISPGAQTKAEADAVADLEEGKDTRILSVKKVGFTAGFFHRVSRICEDVRKNLWLLITAPAAAVMAAVISGVFSSSLNAALYTFCVTISFAFPTCSLMLHKLPVAQLFRRAAANRCAVVGEVSAIEYCDAAAAAFEDVEAFPARNVRVQRIKLYSDSALDHVLYQVAGLFSAVGGPLDGVFRSSTAELGLPSQVRLLRVAEGGILAMVDGREVCVGRGEYMLKNRIRMYYDPEDESILANGKVNIMYAAENGRLTAKFYIRYKMDEDFEKDVEQLHKRGIRTVIRTYDPNIGEDLVANISYTSRFNVRIVKKTADQQSDFAVARLNSGIVTKSTSRDILRTLFACRRMCRLISLAENYSLLVACAGMLLSLVLSVLGAIFTLPSFFLAVYQLVWIGIVALAGKFYI